MSPTVTLSREDAEKIADVLRANLRFEMKCANHFTGEAQDGWNIAAAETRRLIALLKGE